jgi:hypothetical protein
MTRIRRVESQKKKEEVADNFMTRGYKIKKQTQYTTKVKKKEYGDIYIHIFMALFVLLASALAFDIANLPAGGVWGVVIAGNLLYAAYSWYSAEEIIIKVEPE